MRFRTGSGISSPILSTLDRESDFKILGLEHEENISIAWRKSRRALMGQLD